MYKLWIAAGVGMLFSAGLPAQSFSGTISDSACGARHESATVADAACVQRCIKRGGAPVLVSGGKVYQISAETREKVKDVLGQKVTINGTVDGDVVSIDTVELVRN